MAWSSHFKVVGYTPYNNFAASIALLNATAEDWTLVIPRGTHTISADLTCDSNIKLIIHSGADIAIATGVTLTINGPIEAGPYQIFSWTGTGKVVLGKGSCSFMLSEWWGAAGDGVTDDSTAIQAAIDCANYDVPSNGPATIKFLNKTYLCNVTIKSDVHLTSDTRVYGDPLFSDSGGYERKEPILKAAGAGAIIDTPVAGANNYSIRGIGLLGLGAGTAVIGLHHRAGNAFVLEYVGVGNVANQAFLIDAGPNHTFKNVYGNGLRDTSSVTKVGVLELGATDCYLEDCEFGAHQIYYTGAKISAGLYNCAIKVTGYNNNFVRVLGELSEIGWHVAGGVKAVNCRAEFNQGHGWDFTTASWLCELTDCRADRNSLDATDTYNGFNIQAGTSGGLHFTGCRAYSLTTAETYPAAIRRHKYGFNDASNTLVATVRNTYTSCSSENHVTAWFANIGAANANLASVPTMASTGLHYLDAGATIDVDQKSNFALNYTVATEVTDFTGGVRGQRLTILHFGNVTIKENANIHNISGADTILAYAVVYHYVYWWGQWYQEN